MVYNTYSQNFQFANDTFKVKGILMEKFLRGSKMDTANLTNDEYQNLDFRIRVVEVNYENVLIDGNEIASQSIFTLNLATYDKQIGKN